jgi:hypothetical protein
MGVTPASSRQHRGDEAPRPDVAPSSADGASQALTGRMLMASKRLRKRFRKGFLETFFSNSLPPTSRCTTALEARAGAREPATVVSLVVFERPPERPGTTVAHGCDRWCAGANRRSCATAALGPSPPRRRAHGPASGHKPGSQRRPSRPTDAERIPTRPISAIAEQRPLATIAAPRNVVGI